MPYIRVELRDAINNTLFPLKEYTHNRGALNYIITKILLDTKPECYEDYNALIGVLECVKLELYRRAVVPYEEKKKKENSDVY